MLLYNKADLLTLGEGSMSKVRDMEGIYICMTTTQLKKMDKTASRLLYYKPDLLMVTILIFNQTFTLTSDSADFASINIISLITNNKG